MGLRSVCQKMSLCFASGDKEAVKWSGEHTVSLMLDEAQILSSWIDYGQ